MDASSLNLTVRAYKSFPKETYSQRFWRYVDKDTESGCWEWVGHRNYSGYGVFRYQTGMVRAHRFSWMVNNEIVPEGPSMNVLHRCDNRSCVNPSHLFLGTHAENIVDRDAKGRQYDRRGELHPSVKLTEDKVLKIREMYATGNYAQRPLAAKFGIDQTSVSEIVCRKTWKHI